MKNINFFKTIVVILSVGYNFHNDANAALQSAENKITSPSSIQNPKLESWCERMWSNIKPSGSFDMDCRASVAKSSMQAFYFSPSEKTFTKLAKCMNPNNPKFVCEAFANGLTRGVDNCFVHHVRAFACPKR